MTAEKALERHDREDVKNNSLSICTDGSGINNEIGSAVVCPLVQQTRSAHMALDSKPLSGRRRFGRKVGIEDV